jgi:hypothetical protein
MVFLNFIFILQWRWLLEEIEAIGCGIGETRPLGGFSFGQEG